MTKLHMLRFSEDTVPFWGCESRKMFQHNSQISIAGLTAPIPDHDRHSMAATTHLEHVTCRNYLRSAPYKAALLTS